MKIVTTTLSNGNESIIADALFSVQPFADINLIIDNGITDRTLDIAKGICGPDLAVVVNPGGHGSRAAGMRCGFRGPQGLFEGPYEVLEKAYAALGAPAGMLEAIHADVERRTREREAWQAGVAA